MLIKLFAKLWNLLQTVVDHRWGLGFLDYIFGLYRKIDTKCCWFRCPAFCFSSLHKSKVVVKLHTGNKLELIYFTWYIDLHDILMYFTWYVLMYFTWYIYVFYMICIDVFYIIYWCILRDILMHFTWYIDVFHVIY